MSSYGSLNILFILILLEIYLANAGCALSQPAISEVPNDSGAASPALAPGAMQKAETKELREKVELPAVPEQSEELKYLLISETVLKTVPCDKKPKRRPPPVPTRPPTRSASLPPSVLERESSLPSPVLERSLSAPSRPEPSEEHAFIPIDEPVEAPACLERSQSDVIPTKAPAPSLERAPSAVEPDNAPTSARLERAQTDDESKKSPAPSRPEPSEEHAFIPIDEPVEAPACLEQSQSDVIPTKAPALERAASVVEPDNAPAPALERAASVVEPDNAPTPDCLERAQTDVGSEKAPAPSRPSDELALELVGEPVESSAPAHLEQAQMDDESKKAPAPVPILALEQAPSVVEPDNAPTPDCLERPQTDVGSKKAPAPVPTLALEGAPLVVEPDNAPSPARLEQAQTDVGTVPAPCRPKDFDELASVPVVEPVDTREPEPSASVVKPETARASSSVEPEEAPAPAPYQPTSEHDLPASPSGNSIYVPDEVIPEYIEDLHEGILRDVYGNFFTGKITYYDQEEYQKAQKNLLAQM